ncbi:MAG TPA: LysR substrate-binding domain-containing protein [Saprospiraceae bacterium]|nr:LysR substrate-binding domain-containing protein [Saprospiraceae bacterium]HNM26607.1 LysR substrate-binding domain-containing protein [Saprospiraceae bacterium]
MVYTLHQLKIFIKVTECQSITRASEELYLTQPAVSLQLKKFQEQFAIPLTEVVGKKLYITDFGHDIAASARKILEEIEAINYKTKSFKGQLAGRLKISTASTGKYVMPYFLSDFLRQHPGVDLLMDVTNKTQVVRNLEQNEVDFSLVSVVPEHLKLNTVQLLQNKLFLVGGTRIQRNPKTPVRKLLEQHPLLYREFGSATRNAMEQFVEKEQWPDYKKIELTSNEALKQALIAGLGYSVMPLIGIKNELKSNDLEIIPCKGLPIITHWNLVWLAAKKLSPIAEAYLDFIRREKDSIINDTFSWFEAY